jgi:hypothetical protein
MKTQFAILIILIIIMILIYNFGNYFYDLVDPEFIVDDQEDNIMMDFKPIPVIKTQRSMDHKWLYDATFQELNLEEHPILKQKMSDAGSSQSSALAPIYNMANHPALANFIYQAPINYGTKQIYGKLNDKTAQPNKNIIQASDTSPIASTTVNLTTTPTPMSSRGTTIPNTTTTTTATSANNSYSTTLTLTTLFSTTPYSTTPYSTTPTFTPTFTTTLPNYKYLGQIYLVNNINSGDNVITVDGSTIYNEAGTTPSVDTSPGATTTNKPITTASSSFTILPGMIVLLNGKYYTITGVDMGITNSSNTTTNINAFTLKEAFSNNTINLDGEVIGSVSQGTYLNIYLSNNHSTSAAPSTTPYSTSTTPYSTSTTPYSTSTTPYLTSTTPYSTSTTPYSTTLLPNSTPESNSNSINTTTSSINTTTSSINTTTTSSSLNVILTRTSGDFRLSTTLNTSTTPNTNNVYKFYIILSQAGYNKLNSPNLIANGSNKFCFIFNSSRRDAKAGMTIGTNDSNNRIAYVTMPSSGLMLQTVQPTEWSLTNPLEVDVSAAINKSIAKEPSFTGTTWPQTNPAAKVVFMTYMTWFDEITVIPENLYTITVPDAYLILNTDYTCSISTTRNSSSSSTMSFYDLVFLFTPAGMQKINYYFINGINDFYFYYAASTSTNARWSTSALLDGIIIDQKDFNLGIHISSSDTSNTTTNGTSLQAKVTLLSFVSLTGEQTIYATSFNYNVPNTTVVDSITPQWFVPQTNLYFFNGKNNPTPPTLMYHLGSNTNTSRWK